MMPVLENTYKRSVRVAKNYTKGYSSTQMTVRNATSNDPYYPSTKVLNKIARLSYEPNDFVDVLDILDKRLNDKGKNWRHVFKSLLVLEYLLYHGAENVVLYCRDNLYEIRTLREFQYIDDRGNDQGVNVRQKAQQLTALLSNPAILRERRRYNYRRRDSSSDGGSSDSYDVDDDIYRPSSLLPQRITQSDARRNANDQDEDFRRAIEESKRLEEQRKEQLNSEERDVLRAIELSKEDEEKRRASVSITDAPSDERAPDLIDLNAPSSAAPIQPQFTQVQPQYTFNPFLRRPQQEVIQLFTAQQAAAQQEEYLRQRQQQLWSLQYQQQQAQTPLISHPTNYGSNNPFARSSSARSFTPSSMYSSSPSHTASLFASSTGTPSSYTSSPFSLPPQSTGCSRPLSSMSSPATPQHVPRQSPFRTGRTREGHSRLASLYAGRTEDGVDTFGNVGQLRFGSTQAGQVAAQRTGPAADNVSRSRNMTNNPFAE